MRTVRNDDGTTSYTLTETEKVLIFSVVSYALGRRIGYTRGRSAMAREIHRTGQPRP